MSKFSVSTLSGTFAALRERDYAWYFAGNIAFFMAMQMNLLLRGYLAYEFTNAAVALGLIAVSIALPMLFVAPLGGVIADRYNKRTLLVISQSFVAVVNLVLVVLIVADLIEFWHLLVATVGIGFTISIAMPIRQAMVPMLVPQHRMMNAISLQMGSMNVTRIIGPAVAGFLIEPLGLGAVWAIGVGLYLVSVVSVLPLPKYGMTSQRLSQGFLDDLLGGFRYIARQPVIRLLIIVAMVMPLFMFPVQQILPVFAEDVFQRGPNALGQLMAAAGVGGLVGALIAANLDNVSAKGMLMFIGAMLMGVAYIVFAFAPSYGLALLMFGVGNVGAMVFQTTNNATVQAIVDDDVRGRVMSVLMMAFGITPLGILPLTIAADTFGAASAVGASSVLMLVLLLAMFAVSSRLRGLSLDVLTHAELSPAQAAKLVAEGKVSQEEANRLMGRGLPPPAAHGTASIRGTAATRSAEERAPEQPVEPRSAVVPD